MSFYYLFLECRYYDHQYRTMRITEIFFLVNDAFTTWEVVIYDLPVDLMFKFKKIFFFYIFLMTLALTCHKIHYASLSIDLLIEQIV